MRAAFITQRLVAEDDFAGGKRRLKSAGGANDDEVGDALGAEILHDHDCRGCADGQSTDDGDGIRGGAQAVHVTAVVPTGTQWRRRVS